MRKSRKQIKKLVDKKCYFCPEDDYDLLDVHRIVPGAEGGTYHSGNMVTVCANCHRRCHASEIKIDRYYDSTAGRKVLHYWVGEHEFWE